MTFTVRVLFAIVAVIGCVVPVYAQTPPPPPPPGNTPLGPPPVPANNPQTAAKINLGAALFWEEQLSVTGTVACGTCHRSFAGGADPRTSLDVAGSTHPGPDGVFGNADDIHSSAGVPSHGSDGLYASVAFFGIQPQAATRKSPSMVNAAYAPLLFWDGRAGGSFADPATGQILIPQGGALESQSIQPLINAGEMSPNGAVSADVGLRIANATPLALATAVPASIATWINGRAYPALFNEVFGSSEITAARIAMAIASYERTLVSTQAPIDAVFAGTGTLTPQEQQGQGVFLNNDCAACHSGNVFTDNNFRYIGVRPVPEDQGRFTQTGNNGDRGSFRTPSLRNVALRAPFMHNGRLETLADVVEFYNRGGDFNAPNKDPRVRPRGLSAQQKAALVAFLSRPLTDTRVQEESGPFERPTLFTESGRGAQIVGTGQAGSGNFQPRMIAIEPPLLGNRNFTVATSQSLGGAVATLVVAHADPGVANSIPVGDVANLVTTLDGTGAGQGVGSVNVDLSDASLPGQTLFGRWYITDPAAPNGLAVSQAFQVTVFGDSNRIFAAGFD